MWLHLPPSCPSAQASEDSTLPSDEFFQMLSTSVMWRSKPLPPRSWQRVWKTAPWVRRQFGPISRRFAADTGAVTSISSPLAFPANPSPSPGVDSGTKTPATSGRTSGGLSTGRDRVSSFSKTSQVSLLFDNETDDRLTPWCESSWNDWVTQLRAVSLQRRKLARLINGNGCSSSDWPTPSADGSAGESDPDLIRLGAKLVNSRTGRVLQTNLATEVGLWPTPQASDDQRDRQSDEGVLKWSQREQASSELAVTARLWATPSSRDHKDTDGMATTGTNPDGSERERLDQLPRQVFQFGLPAPQTPQPGPTSSVDTPTSPRPSKRRLNPRFVEWLMGWPLGWTAYAPVATASSRKPQPTPYSYSSMERGIK
jgi:hypothetical protein